MTKGQMKSVQNKITSLEKILMRDLDEQEVDYLTNHSVNEFLYEVLGFDQEDLLVLLRIKKIISDWCTRPAGEINTIEEDMNFFFDSNEFENEDVDINFFKDTSHRINRKVSDVLSSIIGELQNEQRKYVKKEEGANNIEITSNVETGPKEFEFDENDEVEDDDFESDVIEDDTTSIYDLIPENSKKWAEKLTIQEVMEAMDTAISVIADEYLDKGITDPDKIDQNEITGEWVDQIKDLAIEKFVQILNSGETVEFEDEEIQAEVLDYLYNHNYKVKSINNKVSLL